LVASVSKATKRPSAEIEGLNEPPFAASSDAKRRAVARPAA